jgi:hypothetical protein
MLGRRSYRNFTSSGFPKSGNNATSPQFVTLLKATIPIQKISQSQMDERRKKCLCYNCDSKWYFGHKCQNPKLFLLNSEEIIEELDLSFQSELEG